MANNFIKKLYYKFRTLILYGLIGSFSSTMDFLVYTLLTHLLLWHYIVANCLSVMVGIMISFILNRSYNFKVKDRTKSRFVIFLAVGLGGMALSNIILFVTIDLMAMNQLLGKLLSIVLVVVLQFLLNKYITFHVKKNKTED